MKAGISRIPDRVALLSAPWPLFNRPSIQLGALKAFLRTAEPEISIDTHHFYLRVADELGFELYRAISERSWPAEAVYGALLYPDQFDSIHQLFRRETRGNSALQKSGFEDLVERVRTISEGFLAEVDWAGYGLVGFSVCLCQLTASLYLMRRIKAIQPALTVVAGGSSWVRESADAWFRHFPEIDHIVLGEGELPLLQLIHRLRSDPGNRLPLDGTAILSPSCDTSSLSGAHLETTIMPSPSVWGKGIQENDTTPAYGVRHSGSLEASSVYLMRTSPPFQQMQDLDELPVPDFDDYFDRLKALPSSRSFIPTLPVEISRGCWWRGTGSERRKGCGFCNLNLQWDGYRSKSPQKVVAEIDALTTRYRSLSIAVMDNVLPLKDAPEIFRHLAYLGKDLKFFAEARATLSLEALRVLRTAGVEELQVGIEALSTRLLSKMNKGTAAIQNLEIMKHCEELGIRNSSNLMIRFPGSDEEDVSETLRVLEFAIPYRPLHLVRFWLGLDSPVWASHSLHGIRKVCNHPNFAAIFPQSLYKDARFILQGYRGDLRRQRQLWRPVEQQLKAWRLAYESMRGSPDAGPALGYRDGKDFLIIFQRRPQGATLHHRLSGASRAIYLFCRTHRSMRSILTRFPAFSEGRLRSFLQDLVQKRVMYEERDRYLGLAVAMKVP